MYGSGCRDICPPDRCPPNDCPPDNCPRATLPLVTGYVGFTYYPLVRLIGPSVSACDHRPQKILGAANVDLGLVSSCEAQANQTQVNISPPKFFVGLACATRTKFPLPDSGRSRQWAVGPRWAVVARGQLSPGGSRRRGQLSGGELSAHH